MKNMELYRIRSSDRTLSMKTVEVYKYRGPFFEKAGKFFEQDPYHHTIISMQVQIGIVCTKHIAVCASIPQIPAMHPPRLSHQGFQLRI